VKIPAGRGCGFVQFAAKEAAEMAIHQMTGSQIGAAKVRCAWGRPNAMRPAVSATVAATYYQQPYAYQQQYQVCTF